MFDITCIFEIHAPCSFPHGIWFSLVSIGFTLVAWIFAITTLRNCNYMTVTVGEEDDEEYTYGIGLLRYRPITRAFGTTTSYCTKYSEEDKNFDIDYIDHPLWKVGVAMSSLTIVFGIIILVFTGSTSCISYNLSIFSIFFYLSMICFVTQTLVFLVWGNDKLCDKTQHLVCKFGKGCATNIFAACLWLWAANMIKSFPEYLPPRTRTTTVEDGDGNHHDDSPPPSPSRRTRESASSATTARPQSQRQLPPPPSSPKKKTKPLSQRQQQQQGQKRNPNASRPKPKQSTKKKRSGANTMNKK